MSGLLIQYRPLNATDRNQRRPGAIWSEGPKAGTKWVIPGDNGPRRYILVRKEARTQVWIEITG
jgi:hypothetical protein